MSLDLLLGLLIFAFVSSITPGPNNIMLMTSGATWGFARSVPHLLGVALGFVAMATVMGLGLAELVAAAPRLQAVLKAVAAVYLVFLAWRIATAAAPVPGRRSRSRPLTFTEAAAFQWINPKAWAMALTALAAYVPPEGGLGATLTVAAVFGLVNLPSVAIWVGLGTQLRRWLERPSRRRAFNAAMAALLLLSLWPILAA